MNSKELLEQAEIRVKRINELSDDVGAAEDILAMLGDGEVCFFTSGIGTTHLTPVLSPDKLQKLREDIIVEVIRTRNDKSTELEKLLGIRKPAIINPEFEKAVQEMVKPPFKADHIVKIDGIPKYIDKEPEKEELPKCEPRPPLNELEVENVRRMYHDEAKTMKEIAEYYGVTKTRMNSYISKYNLRRTSYNKASYSDPVDSEKPKPELLRTQANVKKCRVCGKDIVINLKMAWAYKYIRKQNGKVETAYCCSRECLGIGKMKDA